MDIVLLSAIISFLALDITIAFQVLISSPIFACPILGWLLGDVELGFEMGFLLQLLWLGRIPAGAYIVPEGNIASMIATVLVLLNKDIGYPNTTLAIVFVESILISYLGAVITIYYRKFNNRVLEIVVKEIENVHFKMTLLLEAGSVFIYFLMVFIISLGTILLSQRILPLVIPFLGELWEEEFVVIKPLILGIGLAFVLPIFKDAVLKRQIRKNG
jgi:PTS system mannose-specific IIC component